MARRYGNPTLGTILFSNSDNWLSDFAEKVAPLFVAPEFSIPECSIQFCWLADSFTLDELLADLQLCSNSSAGLDGIKFNLFKNLPEVGKHTVLEIFNELFSTGNTPRDWKETTVVSILKPGKELGIAGSYRLISLLSCVRKLFEKIFYTRLDYCVERFDILSLSQCGFTKGRETCECLSLLSSDLCISFERKKKTLKAILDISGAYNNVLIDVLCKNMCGLQLPLEMVRILWNLLHRKNLVFYHGREANTRRVGMIDLP
jgi:hypothetical protein